MNTFKISETLKLGFLLLFITVHPSCKDRIEKNKLAANQAVYSIPNSQEPFSVGEFTIGEPVTERNLQVFLIHGPEKLGAKTYTPLSEAMENKAVTLNETGEVNELSISNHGDSYIFIHSGDIVKGGKQDRTIAQDVIIPPKAKNVALQSFCVEQGRWQQRGGEEVARFASNDKMLSSRKLKMAARYDKSQGTVWQNVAEEQDKLNQNISILNGYAVEVADEVSETSLQLTLENKELKKAKAEMIGKFSSLLESNATAIGYAYAINGEVYGVDIYNNKKLFEALWDKISESIMTESISNKAEDDFKPAGSSDVVRFMEAINTTDKKKSRQVINEATVLETLENAVDNIVFSTIDKHEDEWIHNNYMKKDRGVEEGISRQINRSGQIRTRN